MPLLRPGWQTRLRKLALPFLGPSSAQVRYKAKRAEYIVTACMFCNTAHNRYFDLADKRGLQFDGLTPDQLVAQRLPYVEATRRKYEEFWLINVRLETSEPET
jgi:hypothetical protein